MREQALLQRPMPLESRPSGPAPRILIVDDDPAALDLLTELLRFNLALVEPRGVLTAEEALRILAGGDAVDFLLLDVAPPGMDGLQLLRVARELRPGLKVIVMTVSPSEELQRAALENGAIRLLSKPVDFEDLLASLKTDQPGSLSYLTGDFDLLDICRLSAACQAEGGLRIRHAGGEGVLVHRGTTLVHAMVDGVTGAPAVATLRGLSHWQFESLSGLSDARLAVNCGLDLVADVPLRQDTRATGTLRGLTLRHLIEWAMQGGQHCTLTVHSHQRKGVLVFDAGKILRAETADRDGGRAAAEILDWEHLSVDVARSPAVESPAGDGGEGFAALIDQFSAEVEGFIATSVVRRRDGSAVAGRSNTPQLDPVAAAGSYARVVESHLAAVALLGGKEVWGETEDFLITTAKAYLLIRLLGDGHYHWLAVTGTANLAMCRHLMRSFEAFLLSGLEDLGETGHAP